MLTRRTALASSTAALILGTLPAVTNGSTPSGPLESLIGRLAAIATAVPTSPDEDWLAPELPTLLVSEIDVKGDSVSVRIRLVARAGHADEMRRLWPELQAALGEYEPGGVLSLDWCDAEDEVADTATLTEAQAKRLQMAFG